MVMAVVARTAAAAALVGGAAREGRGDGQLPCAVEGPAVGGGELLRRPEVAQKAVQRLAHGLLVRLTEGVKCQLVHGSSIPRGGRYHQGQI